MALGSVDLVAIRARSKTGTLDVRMVIGIPPAAYRSALPLTYCSYL
jgi:hypothetical protein